MSKLPQSTSGYKIISSDSLGNLEGQLLTTIEALGLPELQEKAFKSLVRNSLWDWYHDGSWHKDIPEADIVKYYEEVVG